VEGADPSSTAGQRWRRGLDGACWVHRRTRLGPLVLRTPPGDPRCPTPYQAATRAGCRWRRVEQLLATAAGRWADHGAAQRRAACWRKPRSSSAL